MASPSRAVAGHATQRPPWLRLGLLCAGLLPGIAQADNLDSVQLILSQVETSPLPQGWTAGGVVLSGTSAYRDGSASTFALPGGVYLGQDLMYLGDRITYTFARQGSTSYFGRLRWRGGNLDPKDAPQWEGLTPRKGQLEAGLGAVAITSAGLWTARWSGDITGRSHGNEVLLYWSAPILRERWLIMGSLGYVWRSSRLSNYYYGGVSDAEATPDRPAYDVGDTWTFVPSVVATYRLSPRWIVAAVLSHDRFPAAVRDSPLVQKSGRTDVLFAVGYSLR